MVIFGSEVESRPEWTSLCYPHPSGCRQSSVCPAGTFRTRMKSAPLSVSEKSLLDIRYFGGRATTSMLIL